MEEVKVLDDNIRVSSSSNSQVESQEQLDSEIQTVRDKSLPGAQPQSSEQVSSTARGWKHFTAPFRAIGTGLMWLAEKIGGGVKAFGQMIGLWNRESSEVEAEGVATVVAVIDAVVTLDPEENDFGLAGMFALAEKEAEQADQIRRVQVLERGQITAKRLAGGIRRDIAGLLGEEAQKGSTKAALDKLEAYLTTILSQLETTETMSQEGQHLRAGIKGFAASISGDLSGKVQQRIRKLTSATLHAVADTLDQVDEVPVTRHAVFKANPAEDLGVHNRLRGEYARKKLLQLPFAFRLAKSLVDADVDEKTTEVIYAGVNVALQVAVDLLWKAVDEQLDPELIADRTEEGRKELRKQKLEMFGESIPIGSLLDELLGEQVEDVTKAIATYRPLIDELILKVLDAAVDGICADLGVKPEEIELDSIDGMQAEDIPLSKQVRSGVSSLLFTEKEVSALEAAESASESSKFLTWAEGKASKQLEGVEKLGFTKEQVSRAMKGAITFAQSKIDAWGGQAVGRTMQFVTRGIQQSYPLHAIAQTEKVNGGKPVETRLVLAKALLETEDNRVLHPVLVNNPEADPAKHERLRKQHIADKLLLLAAQAKGSLEEAELDEWIEGFIGGALDIGSTEAASQFWTRIDGLLSDSKTRKLLKTSIKAVKDEMLDKLPFGREKIETTYDLDGNIDKVIDRLLVDYRPLVDGMILTIFDSVVDGLLLQPEKHADEVKYASKTSAVPVDVREAIAKLVPQALEDVLGVGTDSWFTRKAVSGLINVGTRIARKQVDKVAAEYIEPSSESSGNRPKWETIFVKANQKIAELEAKAAGSVPPGSSQMAASVERPENKDKEPFVELSEGEESDDFELVDVESTTLIANQSVIIDGLSDLPEEKVEILVQFSTLSQVEQQVVLAQLVSTKV